MQHIDWSLLRELPRAKAPRLPASTQFWFILMILLTSQFRSTGEFFTDRSSSCRGLCRVSSEVSRDLFFIPCYTTTLIYTIG